MSKPDDYTEMNNATGADYLFLQKQPVTDYFCSKFLLLYQPLIACSIPFFFKGVVSS